MARLLGQQMEYVVVAAAVGGCNLVRAQAGVRTDLGAHCSITV